MPGHPEYPSQHGCFTAAFSDALAAALHTNHLDVTMPGGQNGSPVLTTTQHFDTVDDIQNQVVDARVWLGFHFRNSVEQGEKLGNNVAGWELKQYFQPALDRTGQQREWPALRGPLGALSTAHFDSCLTETTLELRKDPCVRPTFHLWCCST